jgi:hypothetical protein
MTATISQLQAAVDSACLALDEAVTAATNAARAVQVAELDESMSPAEFEALCAASRAAERAAKIAKKHVAEAQAALEAAERESASDELGRIEAECTWQACRQRHTEAVAALIAALEQLRPLADAVHRVAAEDDRRLARARELSVIVGRPTSAVSPTLAQRQDIALDAASSAVPIDLSWCVVERDPVRRANLVHTAFGVGAPRSVSLVEHAKMLLATGDVNVIHGPEQERAAAGREAFQQAERERAQREFEKRSRQLYEHESRSLGN